MTKLNKAGVLVLGIIGAGLIAAVIVVMSMILLDAGIATLLDWRQP